MKNAVTALLIIAVGSLGLFAYRQTVQVQALNAKLQSMSKTTSFEFQEKCAKQAQEFLSQFDDRNLNEARNHYNATLNKCFVETRDVSFAFGGHGETKILSDAFEGKEYGVYIFATRPNQADSVGSPSECKVTLSTGTETICHSEEEFDALVKGYME